MVPSGTITIHIESPAIVGWPLQPVGGGGYSLVNGWSGRLSETQGRGMSAVERFTLGEIRAAGRAMGKPDLMFRVLKGGDDAGYTVCRFLSREAQDCVKCPERAKCHRALAVQVIVDGP